MKNFVLVSSALGLCLLGAGCATKKYVAKTVNPVAARVTATEAKNTEQDNSIADQKKDLDRLDNSLSRTKELISDVDAKATAAGESAQQANQAAKEANQTATTAQRSADDNRIFAEQGINQVTRTMTAMNKWNQVKTATVLFAVGQSKLSNEAMEQLNEFAAGIQGLDRYAIEVQGFTDKTGSAAVNDSLSQARADAVARYLTIHHDVPVRSISTLGVGYALPVADDKTRAGRAQNRRVEIRLFVPEAGSAPVGLTGGGGE